MKKKKKCSIIIRTKNEERWSNPRHHRASIEASRVVKDVAVELDEPNREPDGPNGRIDGNYAGHFRKAFDQVDRKCLSGGSKGEHANCN